MVFRLVVSLMALSLGACSSDASETFERRPTLDAVADDVLDGGGIEPADVPIAADATDTDISAGDASPEPDAALDVEAQDVPQSDADAPDVPSGDVADDGVGDTAEDTAEDTGPDDTGEEPPIYQGTGDPFAPGPLRYSNGEFEEGREGSPVPFLILVPLGDGPYPVIVFQHGFLLANAYYSELLGHLASHGFVVIAPQMYASSLIPIGQPSTLEEVALADTFYRWLDDNLVAIAGPSVEETVVGLAGHSRGGKVIWGLLQGYENTISAVAGVDPVDGTGGPLGGEDRVISGALDLGIPSLVIGTGLGSEGSFTSPACAPDGDNHVQFYEASGSPAWHVVATDYGHNDMLDDDPDGCFVTCTACAAGDARAPMRATTAGALVAFFRGALQGVPEAYNVLNSASGMPVGVVLESR
ncbi:MAG: chlorophyllase [Flavobacteriales bacterium]|jgi:chlorophyllase